MSKKIREEIKCFRNNDELKTMDDIESYLGKSIRKYDNSGVKNVQHHVEELKKLYGELFRTAVDYGNRQLLTLINNEIVRTQETIKKLDKIMKIQKERTLKDEREETYKNKLIDLLNSSEFITEDLSYNDYKNISDVKKTAKYFIYSKTKSIPEEIENTSMKVEESIEALKQDKQERIDKTVEQVKKHFHD